jgi:hypothetical protein
MDVRAWFKQHFALGVILSGAAGSIVGAVILETLYPWLLRLAVASVAPSFGWVFPLWTWLTSTIPVYRWWYAALMITAPAALAALAYPRIRKSQNPKEPDPRHYCRDTIGDIVWRWAYADGSLSINAKSLTAFCPRCDRTLHWNNGNPSQITVNGRIFGSYTCRGHGRIASIDEPYDDFRRVIADEILLKLRNGEWKGVVKRYGEPTVADGHSGGAWANEDAAAY